MAGSCFIRYWHIPELLPRKIGAWTSPQRHTLQRWRSGKTGRLPWVFGCLIFLHGKNTRFWITVYIPWIIYIYAFYYKIYGHCWHFTILFKHSWHFLRVLARWVFQKMHMNPDLEASVNVRRVLAFGRCSPVPFHSVASRWGRPRPEQEVIILLRTLHLG